MPALSPHSQAASSRLDARATCTLSGYTRGAETIARVWVRKEMDDIAPRARASRSRGRGPMLYLRGGSRHANWLELFFDLVFVLAVAQLGGYLRDHLTAAGVLAFLFLLMPVW